MACEMQPSYPAIGLSRIVRMLDSAMRAAARGALRVTLHAQRLLSTSQEKHPPPPRRLVEQIRFGAPTPGISAGPRPISQGCQSL